VKNLNPSKDTLFAILVEPADRTHDFVETVMQNAGRNVRVFHDKDAAIAWLNGKTAR
jgi:hypothetical protein